MKVLGIALVLFFAANIATAQVTTTTADGGSVVTSLGGEIAINKGSSLHRTWVTIHDGRMPVDPGAKAGLSTKYSGTRGYHLFADLSLKTSEPISAYEIKILLFDVWGDLLRIYRDTIVTDIGQGTADGKVEWYIQDENEVGYVYSVAYISRVATKAGKIVVADEKAVLAEARKISSQLKIEDLSTNPAKK